MVKDGVAKVKDEARVNICLYDRAALLGSDPSIARLKWLETEGRVHASWPERASRLSASLAKAGEPYKKPPGFTVDLASSRMESLSRNPRLASIS